MKTLALAAGVVACCLVTCHADDTAAKAPAEVLPQTTNGNFALYVSNQSEISTVDITIQIDGKTAVSTNFVIGEGPARGHTVVGHAFQLAPGKHKITAVSQKGGVRMEEEIEIKDKHWAYLTYRFQKDGEPKRFTFGIRNEPMVFG